MTIPEVVEAPGIEEAAARAPLDVALEAAGATADDGRQRAVDFAASDFEDLLSLRVSLRNALAAAPTGSALRHVVPWIWRPESTGKPRTVVGQEHGRELRLSRFAAPPY